MKTTSKKETTATARNTKGRNVRLYILEADEPLLDALCSHTGLTITNALTLLVSSGLHALEKDGFRLGLPLEFSTKTCKCQS